MLIMHRSSRYVNVAAMVDSAITKPNAREKIIVFKDARETKNLVQQYMNKVVIFEDEIQIPHNILLYPNGGKRSSSLQPQ